MEPGRHGPLDAIVVLGCNLALDGTPSGAARRRAARAARAYGEHGPRVVVASGGRRWGQRAEADALAELLVSLGVPRAAVLRELCSLSTLENAWYARDLLRLAGLERPGVVTCDWHMPRALSCFARVGLHAIPLPSPSPPVGPVERLSREVAERARHLALRAAGPWVDR